jgi:Flp pilus assembly protein TadD
LLGKAYAAAGRIEDAERELRAAIQHEPYDEERRYDLGYLFLQAQQFDRALEAFREGREVFDKSARITTGIGIAYYGLRSFDDAVDSFLEASRLAPGVEQPCYFLGRMLTQAANRIDEVVESFEAFEAARPESYLGPYLTAIGRLAAAGAAADEATLEEAAAKLERSIERRDDFWESHYELGVLLERLHRYAEAAERLQRAAELNPKSSKPHYRLARVYRRLGKDDLARAERELHARLVEEERNGLKSGGMGGSTLEPVVK